MDFGKESMEHEFERNARTAEAEQSKRAASRVKPTEPDRAGKQSAQRSVGDVERELRGISLKGQKVFHSGYELRDKDKHDISILESLSK